MNLFSKLRPLVLIVAVALLFGAWGYNQFADKQTIQDQQRKIDELSQKNAVEHQTVLLQRKEKCITLKGQYIRSSEPTTEINLDEVVYNETANTCYYWYSTAGRDGQLDEAISDLYSENIVANTAPHCAGKWCMTKVDFDQKKKDLGFAGVY